MTSIPENPENPRRRSGLTKQMPDLANVWLEELSGAGGLPAVPSSVAGEGMENAIVLTEDTNVPYIPVSPDDPNACVINGQLRKTAPFLRPYLFCIVLDSEQIVWIRVGTRPTNIAVVQKRKSIKGVVSGLTTLEGGRINIEGLRKLLPFIDPGSSMSVSQQLYIFLEEMVRKYNPFISQVHWQQISKLMVDTAKLELKMPRVISPGSSLNAIRKLLLSTGISEEDKRNATELIEAVKTLADFPGRGTTRKSKRRKSSPAPLDSIDYAIGLLHYYRPALSPLRGEDLTSSKPDEKDRLEIQRDLLCGICQRINAHLDSADDLDRFLEFGQPQRHTRPSTENPARNVEAAVLADIHGFRRQDVAERLNLEPTRSDKKWGRFGTAQVVIREGRKLLERAFGEEGWETWKKSARQWLEQYIEEYKQADRLRVLPDASKKKTLRTEEEIEEDLMRERSGLPGTLSEQARARTASVQVDSLKTLHEFIQKA